MNDMYRLILLTMVLFSFVGCSVVKEIPVQTVEKVVVRDSIVYVSDTVTVEIPKEVIKEIVPQDTTSILRTSVATSEAKIEKGMLHHRLEQNGAVKTQIDTHYVTQYVEKIKEVEVPVEVIVEKKYTPSWVWWSLVFNVIVILLFALKVYLKIKGIK